MSIYDYKSASNAIKHLARYFSKHFQHSEEDGKLETFFFAVEAFDSLVESASRSRTALRDFEYLIDLKSFEDFEDAFEKLGFLISVKDIFERR